MILVDMNQVTISNLMIQIKNEPLSVDLVRHLVLNSIRSYRSKFCNEFGEVILCYDDKHYWRRDLFPYYKSNRKKDRTESSLDWNELFETLNLIRDELKETFPYKVLQVDGAEADDIIATLVDVVSKTPKLFEKILILSGDKDFIQLQSYDNVKQYSPILKKMVNGHNPNTYIKEHILKGDTSDGVPNVLSQDNTFIDGIRQRPLGRKKIETWLDIHIDDLPDEVKRNYQRNDKLINLDNVPEILEKVIMVEFNEASCGDRSKLLNYFIQSRLKNLTNEIGEF